MNIDTIFYKRQKIVIDVTYYDGSDINFKTGAVTITPKKVTYEAIELPQQLCKDYFKKMADSKYEKGFVFQSTDEIKPNFRISFNGKNYNVKDVVTLPQDYYLVMTAAMHNETEA